MFVALNEHAIATLLLTVVALYLFARDDFPIEVTSLVLLATLALGFTLFPFTTDAGPLDPSAFFAGFSNEAVIAVCALMMIGQGLVQTSALEPVGRALARSWGRLPLLSLLMTLVLAGSVSAFVNNTPVVVLLLPILVGVCLRTGQSPSGVLSIAVSAVVGATDLMTDVYLAAVRDTPPIVALAGLMLLLAILTNVVSNNAAAVIGTPIAIGVAEQLGHAPEPFVLAVLFGANMSFCTPMAYQTNLLIMAAGNYRFGDFLRVGVPLTALTGGALVFALDAIYF